MIDFYPNTGNNIVYIYIYMHTYMYSTVFIYVSMFCIYVVDASLDVCIVKHVNRCHTLFIVFSSQLEWHLNPPQSGKRKA